MRQVVFGIVRHHHGIIDIRARNLNPGGEIVILCLERRHIGHGSLFLHLRRGSRFLCCRVLGCLRFCRRCGRLRLIAAFLGFAVRRFRFVRNAYVHSRIDRLGFIRRRYGRCGRQRLTQFLVFRRIAVQLHILHDDRHGNRQRADQKKRQKRTHDAFASTVFPVVVLAHWDSSCLSL